jgi:hypothetical protein
MRSATKLILAVLHTSLSLEARRGVVVLRRCGLVSASVKGGATPGLGENLRKLEFRSFDCHDQSKSLRQTREQVEDIENDWRAFHSCSI